MTGTHIIQGSWTIQVLRTRRYIEPFESIGVTSVGAGIIGIVIIDDWVHDIHIYAVHGIDHFDKAIQANPGVIVDGNAKILLNSAATESHATQIIGFIQLAQALSRHIDIRIARNRKHPNSLRTGINRHDNIGLGQITTRELLVGIAAQQQNVHAWTGQDTIGESAVGVPFILAGTLNLLANNITDRTRKSGLVIPETAAGDNQQESQKTNHHARPDGYATFLLAFATRTFARRAIDSPPTRSHRSCIIERAGPPRGAIGLKGAGSRWRSHRSHARHGKRRARVGLVERIETRRGKP